MTRIVSREEIIRDLLNEGVSEVVERGHLEAALNSDKPLRVKLGIDPTAPDLHLGHAVLLWKLRAFQELGHKIVLIIGDFTARVGDPSGRSEARKPLGEAEIEKNMEQYLAQASSIIKIKDVEVRYNSEWLTGLDLKSIAELLSAATAAQVLKREDFVKRMAADSDVTMLETFYPLLQGYDSVAVKADVELGGQDQLLNLLMGRKVQRHYKMPEQDILVTRLLVGPDGKKKMSKSSGNIIGLADLPQDMFGKIMSLPDEIMDEYFILAAGLPKDTGSELAPKERKTLLAGKIVARYHGDEIAQSAAEKWDKLFSKKEINADAIPALRVPSEISALDLAMLSGVPQSKSDARRLIEQGAVYIDDKKIEAHAAEMVPLKGGEVLKVGKKDFFRIEK